MTTLPTEINAAAARATSEKVTPMMQQYRRATYFPLALPTKYLFRA